MPTAAPASHATFERTIVLAGLLVWAFGVYVAAVHWPPWGDEGRFLDIIRSFAHRTDLEALRTYPAMNTPLPFLLYAGWGRLAGLETWQLRLLSPILAVATCWLFDDLMRRYGVPWWVRLLGLAVICLNPYVAGSAVFVFTDMLALLMLVVTFRGVRAERPWLVGLGVAGAVLTRQYDIFLALAVVLSAIAAWRTGRPRLAVASVAWTIAALVPTAACFWLWRGLAPDNEIRGALLSGGLRFDPHWLSLYLAAPGIYLAPLVLWSAWRKVPSRAAIAAALVGALATLVFPIGPAAVQIRECCGDTGYVDRVLHLAPVSFLAGAVFCVAALAWLAVLFDRLFAAARSWRSSPPSMGDLFPWLALASFLLVMPFSYMSWEKYLLPALFVIVVILCRPDAAFDAGSRM